MCTGQSRSVVDDETANEQDLVYYVGPNVLALEKRFGFPPGEFRLWHGSTPDVPPKRREGFYVETQGTEATFVTTFVPMGKP